jgi:thioredoxin 1
MPLPAQYKTIDTLKKDEKIKSNVPPQQEKLNRNKCVSSNAVVCIYLSAKWCGPCQLIHTPFDKLSHLYNDPGTCMIIKEDIDESVKNPDYNVGVIPAFIFYKNGQLLKKPDGSTFDIIGGDLKEVEKVLKQLLPHKK